MKLRLALFCVFALVLLPVGQTRASLATRPGSLAGILGQNEALGQPVTGSAALADLLGLAAGDHAHAPGTPAHSHRPGGASRDHAFAAAQTPPRQNRAKPD